MLDLSVRIGEHVISTPLGNGAGVCKRLEGDFGARDLIQSQAGFITIGAWLLSERVGNPGNTLYLGDDFALNSLGMPCPNTNIQALEISEIIEIAQYVEPVKPIVVNIAGFSPQEYADMAEFIAEQSDCKAIIEINAGCPNIWKDGAQKEILSRSVEGLSTTLRAVRKRVGDTCDIWVKLSPFFLNPIKPLISQCSHLLPEVLPDPEKDEELCQCIAHVLNEEQSVKAVVAINTIPNGHLEESGMSVITPTANNPKGKAGISGGVIQDLAIKNVSFLRQELDPAIKIIGIGGISSGESLARFIENGATACAMTTEILRYGPREGILRFGEILVEYMDYVEKHQSTAEEVVH